MVGSGEIVEPTRSLVRLGDGRVLDVVSAGPASPDALILCSGTPTGAVPYLLAARMAASRGLRYVGYARPGYADSTRLPGRSVADCVTDVAAIADALGVERLYAIGWSGGGPHALACAALIPGRVVACATIGGVAPLEADGLDWLAGMAPENIAEFGATIEGPAALQPYLEREAASFGNVTGEQVADALRGLIDEVDRGALTGELAEYLAASFRDAVRTGIWGWFDDDLAFARDWGFALGAIDVPVTIWQGGHDRMVPFDHGRWLAGHVAGVHAELLPEEGHLSLAVTRLGDIVDRLVASA